MAVLTVQQFSRAGIDPTVVAAAAGGNAVPNAGGVFLRAKNAHATVARTVTVASQLPAGAIPEGATKTDLAVSVRALGERGIGPLDPAAFNDANGSVVMTCFANPTAGPGCDTRSLTRLGSRRDDWLPERGETRAVAPTLRRRGAHEVTS